MVGFDVFMDLPRVCIKCAEECRTHKRFKIKVQRALMSELFANRPIAQPASDRVSAGKYPLDLPYCEACSAAGERAKRLLIGSAFLPIIAILLALAVRAVWADGATYVILGGLVIVPIAMFLARLKFAKHKLLLSSLDSDGFIVLKGIHPQAGEAIVAASLRQGGQAG